MTQPAAGSGGVVERIKREIAQGSHNSNGRQCVFLETVDVRELLAKLEELRKAARKFLWMAHPESYAAYHIHALSRSIDWICGTWYVDFNTNCCC